MHLAIEINQIEFLKTKSVDIGNMATTDSFSYISDYQGVTLQEFRVLASQKDTGTLRQEMLDAFSVLDQGTGRISRSLLRLLCSGERFHHQY